MTRDASQETPKLNSGDPRRPEDHPDDAPCARLDFMAANGQPATLLFDNPVRTIEARSLSDVRSALAAAEQAAASGCYVVGFVAYEAAPAFDTALTTKTPGALPLVWFGVFDTPPVFPRAEDERPHRPSSLASDEAHDDFVWSSDVTQAEYREAIARVHAAIEAGDSYQANYTFRLRTQMDVRRLYDLYDTLVVAQRAPYAAWLDIGHWRILSVSPELFFRRDGDRLTTRPMKGTARRGLFDDDDVRQREALRQSAKNRAENVMIVDLARNDIGRVAEVGSVDVPSLYDVETYPHVFQMTSTVTGRLRSDVSLTDIFTALFPAGSITGAPKTSSMRLISEIERAPRGVYCGAIGVITPGGDAVFNVAIRTAVVDVSTGAAELGVGGGVTWDSTPDDEHVEALSKASFLHVPPSFDLLETMRLEDGQFVRVDRHLRRLLASARYFGFQADESRIRTALDAHARTKTAGSYRARLLVSRDGEARVESERYESDSGVTRTVALARTPVSRHDRWLFHKTTRREVYERHRQTRPDVFDVLLWNDDEELTEFTIGNLVVEIDGQRYTPPRMSGLLAGIFREVLLETGAVEERVLTRTDLALASRLWLVNSLREWVPVTPIDA